MVMVCEGCGEELKLEEFEKLGDTIIIPVCPEIIRKIEFLRTKAMHSAMKIIKIRRLTE